MENRPKPSWLVTGDGGTPIWIVTNIQPVIWNLLVFWIKGYPRKGQNLVRDSLFGFLMMECPGLAKRRQIPSVLSLRFPSLPDPTSRAPERILRDGLPAKLGVQMLQGCLKLKPFVLGLHQAATGFQRVISHRPFGPSGNSSWRIASGAQNWQVKTILGYTGAVVQSVLKSVAKLAVSIPKRIVLLPRSWGKLNLPCLSWVDSVSSKGLIMYQLLPIFKTMTVCCKSLKRGTKYSCVYHARLPQARSYDGAQSKEAFKNNIRGTYNVAKAVEWSQEYLRWLWFRQIRRLIHQMYGSNQALAELIVTGF